MKLKLSTALFAAITAALLTFLPEIARPANTVSSLSGEAITNSTITLSGTFDASGPTVVLFDNFESTTAGVHVEYGLPASFVGNWSTSTTSGNSPIVSTTRNFGGTQSMCNDMTLGANGGEFYAQVFLSSATQVLVCNDWALIGDWPGFAGTGANMKFNWYMFGNSTTDTDLYRGFSASGSVVPTGSVYDGNDTSITKSFTANITTTTNTGARDGFHQTCEWIMGLAPGTMHYTEISATGTYKLAYTTTSVASPYLSDAGSQHGHWDRVHIPGFGRVMVNPTQWCHDNVYVATGTNAAARVFIADSTSQYAITKWAMAYPYFWDSSTIRIRVNTGPFANGETAYVWVCDNTDACATNASYPITIGSTNYTNQSSLPTAAPGTSSSQLSTGNGILKVLRHRTRRP